MALSTYSDLQSSIALWINRNDLTAVIPDFVALAEADMNKRLRTPTNENMNTAFSVSSRYTTLPTDFAEMRRVIILDNGTRRELMPAPQASRLSENGTPLYYQIIDDALEVVPLASSTLELTYWSKVPALASNSTNAILTNFPELYLYGSCLQAGYFLDDAQLTARFEPKYEMALRLANALRFRQMGSGLAVRAT